MLDFPEHLAGLRIEGTEPGRMKDDQLTDARRLEDDRLVVARCRFRRQRAPQLRAGVLVERHDLRVRFAADETNQSIAVDERRAGDAPRRDRRVEILDVILLPEDPAGVDVEREQVSHRAEYVDAIAINRRRGARTD